MIITTTPEIAWKTIHEYKGIVSGSALGSSAIAFKQDTRSTAFNDAMQATQNEALDALILHAQRLGANAIVGVSFNFILSGGLWVSATGTAVVIN